ncbi:BASIC LEUCINE ZIPPER 63 [Salix purpurea]|uniref:BASIC LEUCINE ZIPPER 63 n=1 Tax=Salix purpurea TaxID=77065 RepID=A0A9Q0WC41_SALPP|nr:BASIC LEUCINE ZIPPER 63 [Salix purpurea]
MDRVFSEEDNITEHFWSPPPKDLSKMNRSESEWAFERFLQEASAATLEDNTSSNSSADKTDVVQIKDHGNSNNNATSKCSFSNGTCATAASSFGAPASFPVESDDYHAFLKSKLNLACAAVALTRVNFFLLSLLLKLRIYVLYLYVFCVIFHVRFLACCLASYRKE